jgi:hypothetical protein
MNFCYSEQLIFVSSIVAKAEKYTHNTRQVGRSRHHHPPESPTISICPHALFLLYRISCAPDAYSASINICVICAQLGFLTGDRFCERKERIHSVVS